MLYSPPTGAACELVSDACRMNRQLALELYLASGLAPCIVVVYACGVVYLLLSRYLFSRTHVPFTSPE